MFASGGYDEGALGAVLVNDVPVVKRLGGIGRRLFAGAGHGEPVDAQAKRRQGGNLVRFDAAGDRGAPHELGRADEPEAKVASEKGVRDGPAHRPHHAGEPELAHKQAVVEPLLGNLPALRQHRDGDGEVEPGAGLLQRGGREVDGDVEPWQVKARLLEAAPDAVLCLEQRVVGHAHDGHARNAAGEVDLDADVLRLNASQRGGVHREGAHQLSIQTPLT